MGRKEDILDEKKKSWLRDKMRLFAKGGLNELKLEHLLLGILGAVLIGFQGLYHAVSPVGQVIILIVYLGLLLGVAPLNMPIFRTPGRQVVFAGIVSGVLDSYIVLDQVKRVRTVEPGQNEEVVRTQKENQETEGVRAQFLALVMMAALIGGLIVWFGEAYAAGLFNNDKRTGALSALYVVPPVLVFLGILGLRANQLPIKVVKREGQATKWRDLIEFVVGIVLLLITHNPMICLGALLVYAVVTRQDEHLLHVLRQETEMNVMLVLFIAFVAGDKLSSIITGFGLGTGTILPIIPAAIQAVLWGPIYSDPSVHFWMRITTLSSGALLLPVSSLVGVMLFKKASLWGTYMKYSIPYAVLWYCIMRVWIWLTLDSALGRFLEQWAYTDGSH